MNIVAERVNRGLSREVAAKRIGISRETLRLIEQGSVPRPLTAKRIADFYGVQVTDIWPVKQAA